MFMNLQKTVDRKAKPNHPNSYEHNPSGIYKDLNNFFNHHCHFVSKINSRTTPE